LPWTEQAGTAPGGPAGAVVPASAQTAAARPALEEAAARPAPEKAGDAAHHPSPAAPPDPSRRTGNGYATAALALGAAGFTLVTLVPAVVYGILGLRRSRSRGSGKLRCWLGIALAASWAAVAGFLAPHLIQASDPGCAAYKGPGLTAYNKVIADFSGKVPATVTQDISRAVTALDSAAAESRSVPAARDLSQLTAQLRVVLADMQAGKAVPDSALTALNRAAAHTDSDCGTLRL
jgi:hypothetical protein